MMLNKKTVLLVVVCAFFLTAACAAMALTSRTGTKAIPEVVRAHAFELVDKDGDKLVQFKALPQNYPGVAMYFRDSPIAIISFILAPNGSLWVQFNDAEGDAKIQIFTLIDSSGGIYVSNSKSIKPAEFGVNTEGTSFMDVEQQRKSPVMIGKNK